MNKLIILLGHILFAAMLFFIINSLQSRLNDYRFEYNHLQTKLNQCEELSDYAIVLPQIMPPLVWAELKTLNEEMKQKRHWKYEGKEQPLLRK